MVLSKRVGLEYATSESYYSVVCFFCLFVCFYLVCKKKIRVNYLLQCIKSI